MGMVGAAKEYEYAAMRCGKRGNRQKNEMEDEKVNG